MADKTALQESAQALFCSLVDSVGVSKVDDDFDLSKFTTFPIFKMSWNEEHKDKKIDNMFNKHVDAPGISISDLEKFLTDNKDWYISSVLIAKKLLKDVDTISRNFKGIKRPSASEVWFVRGDKPIMKNIEILFKAARETQIEMNKIPEMGRTAVFGDINKWSPADIYFASDKARDIIDITVKDCTGSGKKGYSFLELNTMISNLIDDGELLPLSLKKQTKQVILQKVNFDRKLETKNIEKYGYNGVSDWKVFTLDNPQTRDLKLYFTKDKKDHIKMRHDASSSTFKSEYLGASSEARGGSIGSIGIFCDLVGVIDRTFAKKLEKIYEEGNKEYKQKVKEMGKKPTDPKAKKYYDDIRGKLSAICVTNKIFPMFIDWLEKNSKRGKTESNSDRFVKLIYQYMTSRTKESSKFVIAK